MRVFVARRGAAIVSGNMPIPTSALSPHPTAWRLHARLRVLAMLMAASLPAVSTASFVLDPPSSEDIKWQPRRTAKLRPFLNGQVALIASWTALGCTPWYGRSAVAVLTFLLVTRTVQDADPVLARYFYQPWEIHTVALLSFTLFGALRAVGLRAEAADAAAGKRSSSRQFDLRRLFAWVTCAAVITLAWKHWFAVELQRGQSWPAGLPDCRQLAFATANSFAAAGLVANLILTKAQTASMADARPGAAYRRISHDGLLPHVPSDGAGGRLNLVAGTWLFLPQRCLALSRPCRLCVAPCPRFGISLGMATSNVGLSSGTSFAGFF